MMNLKPRRLTIKNVHDAIGITPDIPGYGTAFGPRSRAAFMVFITNRKPARLTDADFQLTAAALNVDVRIIRAVNKVEAPRGAFDSQGRVSILYERHVFARNTDPVNRFNSSHPSLSSTKGYGAGGYGTYSQQYDRLLDAMALDPHAAIEACSWGAFQVLGENWEGCGYADPLDMVQRLVCGEPAHLDSFVRFVRMNRLEDELRACRPGDPTSCIPFVRAYNGPGFRQFDYHTKLAEAAL